MKKAGAKAVSWLYSTSPFSSRCGQIGRFLLIILLLLGLDADLRRTLSFFRANRDSSVRLLSLFLLANRASSDLRRSLFLLVNRVSSVNRRSLFLRAIRDSSVRRLSVLLRAKSDSLLLRRSLLLLASLLASDLALSPLARLLAAFLAKYPEVRRFFFLTGDIWCSSIIGDTIAQKYL